MTVLNMKRNERADYFRSLYETAKERCADDVDRLDKHMRQYLGSTEIDGSSEPALTVRNVTYELIESEFSDTVPHCKVDPACYSESRDRNARSIERLCHALRVRIPFDELNDRDERYTYIYGGSVWYVEWDAEDGDGDVKVNCLSPKSLVPEPGVCDIEDMDYCFLEFTTTVSELCRRYGVSAEDIAKLEREVSFGECDEDDAVRLVVGFYRDECGEVGRIVFSGGVCLSDIPRYYARRIKVCEHCGDTLPCSCENPKTKEKLILAENVDGVSLNYYTPRTFPIIIRKNTSAEASLFGESDCAMIRPQQQAINKIESRILRKLLRSGVTPVIPEDATVTPSGSVFGEIIRMKPGDSLDRYGKVDTTPDVSQDIEEADRLYEHARRILGISDAHQGMEAKNESGYSRALRISQAEGRLSSKRRMKNQAYSKLYRLVFLHYLAFADIPRELSYRDEYGRVHLDKFRRYDFIEDIDGTPYISDDYLFSVDTGDSTEYTRESLWEKNLTNLKSGTLGDMTSPVTLLCYWQCQERAHYPFARDMVEYFRMKIEKEERKEENESK